MHTHVPTDDERQIQWWTTQHYQQPHSGQTDMPKWLSANLSQRLCKSLKGRVELRSKQGGVGEGKLQHYGSRAFSMLQTAALKKWQQ